MATERVHLGRNDNPASDFIPWLKQKDAKEVPVITHGKGVYFWDVSDKRYIDFASQLVSVNLGHQHPRIVAAIQAQAEKLCAIAPSFANEPRSRLSQMIAEVTPGDLNTTFFTNSGSEANDFAFALARKVTGRNKVMARYRSFHGTSAGTLSVSGDPRRTTRRGDGTGVIRFFDPHCYRCSFGLTYPSCAVHCARSIEEVIQFEGPDDIAAIITEPVAGAMGPYVPPPEYYSIVREICNRYGIVFIADEVMTGFGRTGKWFGIEHWNVVPDIMTVSKGINGGALPLSAVVMRDHVAERFEGEIVPAGSTQTGNPLACATGVAAIETYRAENVIENAALQGAEMSSWLELLKERHICVGDVRGLGLLASIELVSNRETREPLVPFNTDSEITARIKKLLAEHGIYTIVRWNLVLVAPPLIITKTELDEGFSILDRVLDEVDKMI